MTADPTALDLSNRIADFAIATRAQPLPDDVAAMSSRLLLDIAGLCIAARNEPYVAAVAATTETGGACTALGHAGGRDMYGAALINGTAAHGEDFDDTFEGGPIHSSAVVWPALLAVGERYDLSGAQVMAGMAVGTELICRLAMVTPKAIHKAGFHPTAVIGAIGATAGVATALGLDRRQCVDALGIAGSLSSGIIEYLADGSWTKRMHAGWAAQSGIRAALMARHGFVGPATVLEGTHGVFSAFAPSRAPDFDKLTGGLGDRWFMPTITFKPYACGTMTQPYVDCAIELAERGVRADEIESIVCKVGEGTVHRLWEPLASKHAPKTGYAGKFSTAYCIAVSFFDRAAGLTQFTEARVSDPEVIGLAKRISYEVDPDNPYPDRFTGHIRVTTTGGEVLEITRDNMRGGAHAPLSDDEIRRKYDENAQFGGWNMESADALAEFCNGVLGAQDLRALSRFRA